jgi:hypothetical protein
MSYIQNKYMTFQEFKDAFPILFSPRFQTLVVISIIYIIASYGFIPDNIAQAFYLLLGGAVSIKTIDRSVDKLTPSV